MQDFSQSPEQRQKMNSLTERGIGNAFENAHTEWRAYAIECLRQVCITTETFTVDDVRSLVKLGGVHTHDNRAMGGVMKTGQARGWLVPTGRSVPSVVGHKVPMQIWKSTIYRKNEE